MFYFFLEALSFTGCPARLTGVQQGFFFWVAIVTPADKLAFQKQTDSILMTD